MRILTEKENVAVKQVLKLIHFEDLGREDAKFFTVIDLSRFLASGACVRFESERREEDG